MENNGPKVVFWVMVLLAWPFFLWQIGCLILQQPVPVGQYKAGLTLIEITVNGQVSQPAVRTVLITLGLELIIFGIATLAAYMNTYYRRGR